MRLIWLVLCLPGLASAQSAAEQGRVAYMAAGCYQCHGTRGAGGVGPKLAPNPLPLPALAAFVRNSSRNMPPYATAVLSDEDLARIHAYLAAIEAGPQADEIPALSRVR